MLCLESARERRADLAVHVIGVTAAVAGAVLLAEKSASLSSGPASFRIFLYIAGLGGMIACSALYNTITDPRWRPILRRLDHAAIFVMIGGTYTALASITVHSLWGFFVLMLVWALMAAGVWHKLTRPLKDDWFSTCVYLLMGWAFIGNAPEFFSSMEPPAVALMIAGCAIYSIGAVCHLMRNFRFHNTIWHACVLVGAACHYGLIFQYCVKV